MAERRITGDYGFSHQSDAHKRMSIFKGVTRYTSFVKLSKIALLILLLVLFGAVILLPMLEQDRAGVRVAFSGVKESTTNIAHPVMKQPRYQGVDEKQQPYAVSAEEAVQQDADTVKLKNVLADMRFVDASWVMLGAGVGVMDITNKTIILSDKVSLNHNQGYELYVDKVMVDLNKGVMYSQNKVEGQSPAGFLQADGFYASRNDKSLLLKGHVKLIIQPKKVQKQ